MDYANSKGFADQLVRSVLDILAKQEDQKQKLSLSGTVTINPQTFKFTPVESTLLEDVASMSAAAAQAYLAGRGQDKRRYVFGPVMFNLVFSKPPRVFFGELTQGTQADAVTEGAADNSVPFLVHPYVHAYHQSGAQVDGFYLGLYALTAPVVGTDTHTVFWSAEGRGSRYPGKGQFHNQQWTEQFNNSNPGFLIDSGS